MKKPLQLLAMFLLAAATILLLNPAAFAKVEWTETNKLDLEDKPLDIAIASDGASAYILCKKDIQIYSFRENKITDTISLKDEFDQIAIAPDGENFLLTSSKDKKLSVIQISQTFTIDIGASPVIGKKDAPVTLFAFLDYQCPYCARIFPTLEQLLDKYPKDVKLVIKHFPLRMHKFAEQASMAALAAEKQDKYREMSKILFTNFSKLTDQTIKQYAQEAGLKMADFDKASADPDLKNQINKDISLGTQVKVRGVPALYINGRPVKDRTIEALSQMVEEELKKK